MSKSIVLSDKWLDDVIEKGKLIIQELARESFIRYRQLGQLVLESGYEKGRWHDAEKQRVMEAWEIKHSTFAALIKLAQMSDSEFSDTVGNFRSLHDWIHPKDMLPRKLNVPLPEGVFDVLYIDPPWQYDNTGLNGSAESHYQTMSLEELSSIELPSADNAVLFLWVTNPMLHDAFKLLEAWGFEYKTNVVWVKTNLEKPGVGFYVRGRHELLFICVKGSFLPDQVGMEPIGSVVTADIQEHSRKPDVFYELIERMYPNGRYLELFARRTRAKWVSWGDELVVA